MSYLTWNIQPPNSDLKNFSQPTLIFTLCWLRVCDEAWSPAGHVSAMRLCDWLSSKRGPASWLYDTDDGHLDPQMCIVLVDYIEKIVQINRINTHAIHIWMHVHLALQISKRFLLTWPLSYSITRISASMSTVCNIVTQTYVGYFVT